MLVGVSLVGFLGLRLGGEDRLAVGMGGNRCLLQQLLRFTRVKSS